MPYLSKNKSFYKKILYLCYDNSVPLASQKYKNCGNYAFSVHFFEKKRRQKQQGTHQPRENTSPPAVGTIGGILLYLVSFGIFILVYQTEK